MPSNVTVTVPATTANLGAGFDCIGAALSMHNQFCFQRLEVDASPPFTITVTGPEADRVQCSEDNLVYRTFLYFFEHIHQVPPAIALEIRLGVPLARGLGSSATAIVGGLVGGNAIAGNPLTQQELMQLAIALEGHPDNVVPALIGGCQMAATDAQGNWVIADVPWQEEITPVVAIPNFELSTETARSVLPSTYSRADAIYNIGHFGLLVRGLSTGNEAWIAAALGDRIHQPYRQSLIPGYEAVSAAAASVGAYGTVISGAGPTLLTLCHRSRVSTVQATVERAWVDQGTIAQVAALHLDQQGATVTIHD